MRPGVHVLLGPPRWSRAVWAIVVLCAVWMLWKGPSVAVFFTAVGFALIASAWQRYLGRRGLWLTDDEVVIANSGATHVLSKAGAEARVIEEECLPYMYGRKPEWDNTRTAKKHLYVVPADPTQERVQVEAAVGLSPRRLRLVTVELEVAFAAAS